MNDDSLGRADNNNASNSTDLGLGDYLWNVHVYLHEYIRFADAKATIIIGFCSAVIGASYAAGFRLPHGFGDGLTWLAWLALAALVAAILSAFLVLKPRLSIKGGSTATAIAGLIFWEDIFGRTRDEYAAKMRAVSDDERQEQLLSHVWQASSIASKKYRWVEVSMLCALLGGLLMGLALLLTPSPFVK